MASRSRSLGEGVAHPPPVTGATFEDGDCDIVRACAEFEKERGLQRREWLGMVKCTTT